MSVTCIIPARGGSKRIPRKNIVDLCGKPLLVRCIERLLEVDKIDRIVVSTDDSEIANIASVAGAQSLTRTPLLADDFTTADEVIAKACNDLQLPADDTVICVYPTSVLFPIFKLQTAIEKYCNTKVPLMSIYESSHPIERVLYLDEDDKVAMKIPGNAQMRTQDCEESFFDAGQFYICSAYQWIQGFDFLNAGALPIILKRHEFLDIDTPDDLSLLRRLWSCS